MTDPITFKIEDKASTAPAAGTKFPAVTSGVVIAPTMLQVHQFGRAYAIAKITADTAIPTSSETEITWTSQEADSAAIWDPALPKRMTAAIAGCYGLFGAAPWASNATGIRVARFWKNSLATGSRAGGEDRRDGSAAAGPTLCPSGMVELAVGDYVTMTAYHTRGSDLNLIGSTEHCYFGIVLLSRSS